MLARARAQGPWLLGAFEVFVMGAVFLAAVPHALQAFSRPLLFFRSVVAYRGSPADLVLFSVLRAGVLGAAFGVRHPTYFLRPYLLLAYGTSAAGLSYVLVKSLLYRFSSTPAGGAAAALLLLSAAFSCLHVLAARRAVAWARRRAQLGLMGFGIVESLAWGDASGHGGAAGAAPWVLVAEEGGAGPAAAAGDGESAPGAGWLATLRAKLLPDAGDGGAAGAAATAVDADVEPEALADDDSRWLTLACGGAPLRVHYKEVRVYGQYEGEAVWMYFVWIHVAAA
jgi:hypothetical protein